MASLHRVTLNVFPGAFNWPVWVARQRGFFARVGIEVALVETPGSVAQWTDIARGDCDLAITLMDNVIAYREGQGEAPVTVEDAIAVMAADTRTLPALMARRDVAHYAGLKGERIAIDARATGYALVLIAMLEHGGLGPADYVLERAGGVRQRYEALLRGEYAAALFNVPFDGLLRDAGYNRLDTAASVISCYQGHVLAVRRRWADAHRPIVVGFIRAFREGLRWLYAPETRAEADAIFAAEMRDAPPNAAAIAREMLFHPQTGFPVEGMPDLTGIEEALRLRAKYGAPAKPLGGVDRYFDPGYLREAN